MLLSMLASIFILSSCGSSKDVLYFQDMEPNKTEIKISDAQPITVQPGDKISIIVNCRDPQLTALFNLPVVNKQIGAENMSGTSAQGVLGYTVDKNGEIDFPVIGAIHVAGRHREDIAELIKGLLIKENLVKEFEFTMEQAEAIVTLQLYRLTNTDVVALQEEMANLEKIINGLTAILGSEDVLKSVMKKDLRDVKKEYATDRLTDIKAEITEIKIDTTAMIPKEDCVVMVTKDGYVKRTSFRSYTASNPEDITIKENDYILGIYEMTTLDTLLIFTTHGNYLHIPVHILPDLKWKDMPKHVSNVIEISPDEAVVCAIPVATFDTDQNVVIASRNGMIKRSKLTDFKLSRYTKPTSCMKLKGNDLLVDAFVEEKNTLFLTTNRGYGLSFATEEVPIVGVKAAGVIAMKLKDDYLVSINQFDPTEAEYLSVITDKGTGKRVHLNEFELSTRARRGLLVIREVKSNPYHVIKTFITDSKNYIGIKNGEIETLKLTELNILDRYSIGGQISKHELSDSFMIATLQRRKEAEQEEISMVEVEKKVAEVKVVPKKDKVSLKEIDDRLMTIDDFLK